MTMTIHAQVQAALRFVDFSPALYRSTSAEHFRPFTRQFLVGDAQSSSMLMHAMIAREHPDVLRAALDASKGMMVVFFDVHRLPPAVDLYVDGEGDLVAAEPGMVPSGLTLWDEFFTIVRGPELMAVRSSLVGDGQRFMTTLAETIAPEFARRMETSWRQQNPEALTRYLQHIDDNFFQPAVDHVQALKSALLKMPKRAAQITAYISFCDYFLVTIIREPWDDMRAVVAAAEDGDWSAVAAAAQRRSPESRTMNDFLQPVVESFWPLMAQRAAAVVIDDSVKPAMLGKDVDADQLQQLMTSILARRLAATDGHRSQRIIRIDYDATTRQLRVSDNGYPINQPNRIHWLEQQARACGWTAQVTSDGGHSVIALTPFLPE